MAFPDWFDPRLRLPTPRTVVAAPSLNGFRWTLAALAVGVPLFLLLATRHPSKTSLVACSATFVGCWWLVLEPTVRRERRRLRDWGASMARIVPARASVGDVALGFLEALGPQDTTSYTIVYEYATRDGVRRKKKRFSEVHGTGPSAAFPEGKGIGARFVVLVDPANPSKCAFYDPRGWYRIAAPAE